ncbi:hypothetical protein [Campylobacter sp. MG1]|uniref:hypothetical protein n=1 Tax=Campylobacter sp. MG1 TaxID=2976332 RepID=UPI00226D3562|nr:hypothetical protein [Campylobacter sp. MG1]
MKYIVFLIMALNSLFASNFNELYNQLPTNWSENDKNNTIKYYKEYGKNYKNISEYANAVQNDISKMIDISHTYSEDDNFYKHYRINSKAYLNYLDDLESKAYKREKLEDFNDFVYHRGSRLYDNLKSELQSYYAVLNASNIKNSWLDEYTRDYNKALKMNSSYDEIVFNIFIKAHFNEYELSKNAKNEIIATDKALGLSVNVGDIESFNYYTLKAFILNYLASILGLITGIILCVKYKDKKLIYISPVLLFIIGLTIDYYVIGIKLLRYV